MTARQWQVELLQETAFAAKIYAAAAVLGAALVLAGAQFGGAFVQLQTVPQVPQFETPKQQNLPGPVKNLPNDTDISSEPVLLTDSSNQNQVAAKLRLGSLREASPRRESPRYASFLIAELRKRQEFTKNQRLRFVSLKKEIERGVIDAEQATDLVDEISILAALQRTLVEPDGPFAERISDLIDDIKIRTADSSQLRSIQDEMMTKFEEYNRFISDLESQKNDLVDYFRLGLHERASSTILRSLKQLGALMKADRVLSEKARKALESLPG